jgi:cytochrome c1
MRESFSATCVHVCLIATALLSGCRGGQELKTYAIATNGDPGRGHELIESYGCGSCHTIPGVHNANGLVGPPLMYFSRRTMIAGELPNTSDNLARWLEHPRSVEPKTAMPELGLNDDQADDMVAYLYTLR